MKKFFYLVVIFLVVGVWLGINFAKNQPLFSNPFADKEVRERAVERVEKLGEKAKDVVDRTIEKTLGD
ncbi:MAG: PRA1 family protein [Gammaproteobacteria bacterium]|nr:PRA1 family protein [Gammaproteobacteria bacterium]